jgi:hypothetical protein
MDFDFIQHAIVTLAATGAAWVLVRRVFGVVKPSGGGAPKCASCPAAQAHQAAQPLSSDAKPLTLIR